MSAGSRTSSLELCMKPVTRSNAKSLTLGIVSSHVVKLYTPERGSCNQCTPGLNEAMTVKPTCEKMGLVIHLNKTRSRP
jgi:hypothetical protein